MGLWEKVGETRNSIAVPTTFASMEWRRVIYTGLFIQQDADMFTRLLNVPPLPFRHPTAGSGVSSVENRLLPLSIPLEAVAFRLCTPKR